MRTRRTRPSFCRAETCCCWGRRCCGVICTGVPVLGLAPLGSNPFPDATPEFFGDFEKIVNQSVQGEVRLWLPYARLHKVEVMQRGRAMPLSLTFSCIQPRGEQHCGACNKCAERQHAFRDANIPDPTDYARPAF